MPVTNIKSESQYKEITSGKGQVAIHFVAPWDEGCKALAPKFDGYATKYGSDSFKFYRADINEHEDVSMGSGVKSPCVHFYKDGEKTKEYVGDSYPALERALGAFIKA